MNLDFLESARQRAVFLEVAVLGVRRRTHAAELSALKQWLQHIGRVHRGALRGAGAEDRVNFVDEDDGVVALLHGFHECLEACLEVASILGSREHRADVERVDLDTLQIVGNGLGHDLLRQALCNRGFPDAALTDQDRIVLASPRQDVDDALDLIGPAHEWIQLLGRSALGQIAGEGRQRILDLLLVLAAEAAVYTAESLLARLVVATGTGLAHPVRDVAKDVESRDPVGAKQLDRLTIGFLEYGGQDVASLNLFALSAAHVLNRGLNHAVESQGLLGVDRLAA